MKTSKVDLERLSLPIDAISPSAENALRYRPVTPGKATIALADSIRENGIATRDKRWSFDSIRAYLASQMESAK